MGWPYRGYRLGATACLSPASKAQLQIDIERVLDFEHPYTEDDLFERIERLLLDWCRLHPDPVARELNPQLHR
jgi:hypothetical protein